MEINSKYKLYKKKIVIGIKSPSGSKIPTSILSHQKVIMWLEVIILCLRGSSTWALALINDIIQHISIVLLFCETKKIGLVAAPCVVN